MSGVSNTFTYTVAAPELNAAPVANPTVVSNVFAATALAPEVTITDDQSSASVTNGTQVTYTLKFSEAIKASTLTETDLTVTNGTLVAGSLTQVDATTWTVKASAPASGSGATAISLTDGSYTSSVGVNGLGNSATQAFGPSTVSVLSGPVINGPVNADAVPTGWTKIGTPDLNDYTNSIRPGLPFENLNGTSSNGGEYMQFVSGSATSVVGLFAEGASTTLTGLVAGQIYSYAVEWQQHRMSNYEGGQLAMTIDGTKHAFTSSGVTDGWQQAVFKFVATSSTAQVTLAINGTDGSVGDGGKQGAIVVDSLAESAITANAVVFDNTVNYTGTTAANVLVGTETDEAFNIATGATTPATGTDKVFAGAGNDTVIFNSFNAGVMTVDGGSGVNFLKLDSAATATSLDLTDAAVRARIKNFSSIDLTGAANNTLKLNYAAVVALSGASDAAGTLADESKMLVVSGNAGDTLNLVNLASWNVGAAQTAASLSTAYGSAYNFLAGHTYKAYTLNGATVFVDQAITVANAASSTTASVAYSQAVTIDSLFAATFTDSNAAGTANATFKGVAITTAGSASDVTNLGKYQLSKDGGATWTDVAGGLTDSTAVYADKTALIRFAGASGVEAINPPNLTVRLIDNSGATGTGTLTAASTGNTVNASVNGGSTAFSGGNSAGTGDTVTINLLNRAPVSSDADGVVVGDAFGAYAPSLYTPVSAPSGFTTNGNSVLISNGGVDQSAVFAVSGNPYSVQITVGALNTPAEEVVRININGTPFDLRLADIALADYLDASKVSKPVLSTDGFSVGAVSDSGAVAGTITIFAKDVPGGVISSVTVTDDIAFGGNGIWASVSSGTVLASTAQSVEALFGGTYTDADFDTMRGVVITSAGTGTDLSNLGQYQYSTNGGTTWTNLAAGLTDSTSVFLAKTDLIRFVPSATNTSLVNKQDLTARLVDDSAAVAPTSGAAVDVSGTKNGGSTPYSGNAVTLHVEPVVNSAPVLADTALSFANLAQSATPVTPTGAVGVLVSSLLGGVTDANATDGKGMAIMVDGGTGFDTLQVSAAGVNLDLTTISNVSAMVNEGASRINSIERINLGSDATANTLTLTAKDVNDMADFNSIRINSLSDDGKTWSNVTGTALSATTRFHQVVVEGTVADTLNLGAGFTQVGTVSNGAATYNVYQNTATNSQVIVDSAISNVVMDQPPTLVSTSPADNAQVAANNLATNLTLTFNEVVKAGTGVIELYNASTNALVESFDVASSTKLTGWNSTTLTINPTSDLTAGTGYYVKVAATAVKDLGGNAYAGITDTTTFNFLTLNSDGSIPALPPYGSSIQQFLGSSVSRAGDVNGDGYDDVIVGASGFGINGGAAYVVYGNAAGKGVSPSDGTIASSDGFKITGTFSGTTANSKLGYSVSGIGDINGDGYADVMVGERYQRFALGRRQQHPCVLQIQRHQRHHQRCLHFPCMGHDGQHHRGRVHRHHATRRQGAVQHGQRYGECVCFIADGRYARFGHGQRCAIEPDPEGHRAERQDLLPR